MLTKLLSTFGFLIAFVLSLYIGSKQQKRILQRIRSRNTGLVSYAFTMTILFLTFVEFWCLTRIFPYYVVVALVVASFLGVAIHNLIGALAGFGLKEKQVKINILAFVFGAQRKSSGVFVLIAALIVVVVVPIGALYKFWRLPIGSAEALSWIAFFLFIVPQVFGVLANVATTAPIMASEFADDDLRNYFLSTQFSAVIYSTVALIYPVWIFYRPGAKIYQWLPPGWVILSIPLLIFLCCYLLPYFVGAARHRAQVKAQLEWRKQWLKETEELLALPEQSRAGLLEQKHAQLDAEVRERIAANELHKFLEDTDTLARQMGPSAAGLDIIVENKSNLEEWDMRFREINVLEQLSQTVSQAGPGNLSGFVTIAKNHATEDLAALSTKRNLLAGGLWTMMSAVGPFLFKAYQDRILELIGKLSHLSH
jgi:hypothetical protein